MTSVSRQRKSIFRDFFSKLFILYKIIYFIFYLFHNNGHFCLFESCSRKSIRTSVPRVTFGQENMFVRENYNMFFRPHNLQGDLFVSFVMIFERNVMDPFPVTLS